MASIGREQILGAHDAVIERVEVPEWAVNGGPTSVCIRRFSAGTRLVLAQYFATEKGPSPDAYIATCAYGCCDEEGEPLFQIPADLPALRKRDGHVVQRIADAILVLNRLTPDTVEDAAKNSESTTAGASPSA